MRKEELDAKNRISIVVQLNKMKLNSAPKNAVMTHHSIFHFLIDKFDLDIEKVEMINLSSMSSLIHNNLVKHLPFNDISYETDGMVGDHLYFTTKSKQIYIMGLPYYIPKEELLHFLSLFCHLPLQTLNYDIHKDPLGKGK